MTASRRARMSALAIAKRRRIREHRIGLDPAPLVARALEAIEEAAAPARVAGNAGDGFDAQEHRVRVAIETDLEDTLHVPGRLALFPERSPRAGPVDRLARLGRLRKRFAVHPREHEHFAALRILGDGGHEPVGIPGDGFDPGSAHRRISIPRAARKRFASGTVISPKWKTEAASTASAPPFSMPSARWSSVP